MFTAEDSLRLCSMQQKGVQSIAELSSWWGGSAFPDKSNDLTLSQLCKEDERSSIQICAVVPDKPASYSTSNISPSLNLSPIRHHTQTAVLHHQQRETPRTDSTRAGEGTRGAGLLGLWSSTNGWRGPKTWRRATEHASCGQWGDEASVCSNWRGGHLWFDI